MRPAGSQGCLSVSSTRVTEGSGHTTEKAKEIGSSVEVSEGSMYSARWVSQAVPHSVRIFLLSFRIQCIGSRTPDTISHSPRVPTKQASSLDL